MTMSDLAKVDIYLERLAKRDEYQQYWKTYIENSRSHLERVRRRERRRLLVVTVIAIVAVIASVLAFIARRIAQTERERAEVEKTKAELAQKEAEAQRNVAVDNLKLYKQEELQRLLIDADTYIKSGDYAYALAALEQVEKIRMDVFPDVKEYKDEVERLRRNIK